MIASLCHRLARLIAGPAPITGPERVALDALRRVQARTTPGCREQARRRHPASLRLGIEQAERGDLVDRGSFAHYLDEAER